jgi:hypothetical protein
MELLGENSVLCGCKNRGYTRKYNVDLVLENIWKRLNE